MASIEGGHAEPNLADALTLFDVLSDESPGLSLEWLMTGRGSPEGRVDGAVKRRDFARLLATGTLLLPATFSSVLDVERLTSAARVDADLIEGWTSLTENYAKLRSVQRPAELLPMLETHLSSLRSRVAEREATGTLWRRMLSITAGTAALAGWTCLAAERRREARAHLELAEQLARETGDRDVLALILMLRADLLSPVLTGGQDGFPELARRHLDEAITLTSTTTPLALRAPLLLRNAEEHAYARREVEALTNLEEATRLAAGSAQTRHHYLRPQWGNVPDVEPVVMAFRGSCLQMLGQTSEAVDFLAASDRRFPGDRTATLTDLASAHAQQGDVDRSCQVLTSAIDLAANHVLPGAARRIIGARRRHLERWASEPVVAALDERLTMIL